MSPLKLPKKVVAHTDGASRGNPGPASIGLVFYDEDGETVFELGEKLGEQTNNFAEYSAVKKVLEISVHSGVQDLTLKTDSQLLVRQMIGQYKVKSESIRPLYLACKELSSRIPRVEFIHVRREFNKRADSLANEALDS
ncbi:MAG: ribonuclease HI family protein [Bdellovibrionales bacterium]|nr:ribonuclease HI family protein [Bdellovibrionales bacterium]